MITCHFLVLLFRGNVLTYSVVHLPLTVAALLLQSSQEG